MINAFFYQKSKFALDIVSSRIMRLWNKCSPNYNKLAMYHVLLQEDETESKRGQLESTGEEKSEELVDGPDTSSFSAFLYSLLSSAESEENPNSDDQVDEKVDEGNIPSKSAMKENGGRRSIFSRGKQTLSRAVYQAARISVYRNHDHRADLDLKIDGDNVDDDKLAGVEMGHMPRIHKVQGPDALILNHLPDVSEPSFLLSEHTRTALYASLPALVQGRRWMLLYR